MREFKFRAWHKERNKMLDVFGVNFRTPATVQVLNEQSELYEELLSCVSLVQYTGLKDTNGKDIYEGDILCDDSLPKELYEKGTYIYGVVLFEDGKFLQSYTHEDTVVYYDDVAPEWLKIKVIGNIYENTKLLVKE